MPNNPSPVQKPRRRRSRIHPERGCRTVRIAQALILGAFFFIPLALPAGAQDPTVPFSDPRKEAAAKIKEDDRLFLDADTLVFDSNRNIVTVKGSVQIYFAGNSLEADEVVYDRGKNTLKAMGQVRLIEVEGNIIRSEEIELSDDFKNGFVNSLQIDAIDETFFAATGGRRIDGTKTVLQRGVYSVCGVCRSRPGRIPTWRIKAEEIIIDEETRKISYKNASFEFLGVPVAYTPRFSHPDPRVKQKTGILNPNFLIDNDLGVGVGIPVYYAIDESSDLTITPNYFSDQGFLGDIEWRKRYANGAYSLQLSGISQDDPGAFAGESGETTTRGGLRTTGNFAVADRWNAGWDILALSDRTFAEDYYRLVDRVDRFTSNVFLNGLGERNYFDARALYFNILDDDDATSGNLQRQQAIAHPTIDYDGIIGTSIAGGQLSYTTNVTSLSRADQDVNVINGTSFLDGASGTQGRASAEIEWKRQIVAPGGHVITPSVSVRGDALAFNQAETSIASVADSDELARGQVTGGLEWRYPVLISSGRASHVVEPIAQLFVSPDETQINRFLNEDSQSFVLDDTNIFRANRFSGFDRVEGGTRANVGFTHQAQWTRWLATDFLAGQSFHLAGQNSFTEQGVASLESQNGLETDRSDIVTRFGVTAIDRYGFVARGRFDENLGDINRGDLTTFFNGNIIDASIGYTFIREQLPDDLDRSSQVNGSFSFKAHEYWTLFADGRYDLDDSRFVNNRIGVTFDDKQFSVSFAFFQDFDEQGVRDGEGVELRVNLRTLGGF